MSKTIMRLMLSLSLILILGSCERRPLVDGTEQIDIRVVLNVRAVLNVTTSVYNERIPIPKISPSVIRVMFYDVTTGELVTQAFISNQGVNEDGELCITGNIKVPAGHYNMVCYNFDTPSVLVNGEDNIKTINAYTSEISQYHYSRFLSSRGDNSNEILPRIYYEPDHLVVAREDDIIIPKHSETITIHTEASTIIDTYYIQVRLVNGQYASDATAVLTDLSPSNKFAIDERKFDEYSATFFEMHRSVDTRIRAANQDVLCATFNTFGKRPDDIAPSVESKLYVTFNVTTVDGRQVEMTVDMDEIFRTPDAIERHWLLIDKDFVIPEPDIPDQPNGDGGMFDPDVEKWDEQEGNIEI